MHTFAWRCGARAAMVLATAALLPLASAPRAVAQEEPDIPVLDQEVVVPGGSASDYEPNVVTLHAVRRVEGGTVIYFSAAAMGEDGRRDTNGLSQRQLLPRLHLNIGPVAALVDPAALKSYMPLPEPKEGRGCLCSHDETSLPGPTNEARVYAYAMAPLPAEVEKVDVLVGGASFPGAPVEDGALEPMTGKLEYSTVLGAGWPNVDLDAVRESSQKYGDRLVVPMTFPVTDERAISEKRSGQDSRLEVAADVLFEFDKATLTEKALSTVQALADDIKARGITTGTIRVVGHTDSQGSDQRNRTLSLDRAKTVAAELRKRLPASITLAPEGKATTEPVATNQTDAGRAQNRRVELVLPEKG